MPCAGAFTKQSLEQGGSAAGGNPWVWVRAVWKVSGPSIVT